MASSKSALSSGRLLLPAALTLVLSAGLISATGCGGDRSSAGDTTAEPAAANAGGDDAGEDNRPNARAAAGDETAPAAGQDHALTAAHVDATYLTQPLWNDGQAEVAFYRVDRTRNQYGEDEAQAFTAATYLVKHDFDARRQSKAVDQSGSDATPAFKYALFYELPSGTYEYKRHHVVNARQEDLAPLKSSFSSFDWCANLYREQAFLPSGSVDFLMRSDDYGNDAGSFGYDRGSYPPALVPLLVRGVDFSRDSSSTFSVLLLDGETVAAQASLVGRDRITTPGGDRDAERIAVSYDRAVPSPIAEESDLQETYWRGTDEARILLQVEGGTGRYRMTLVEHLRSAYWDEDIYTDLEHVTTRP